MAAISDDLEITFSIPPEKLFKAFVLDADTLLPKALPEAFKSVEILEGDGGAGTIKLLTFGEGNLLMSLKQRVDEVDKENLVYKYSFIEGDALTDVHELISHVVKIEASGDGSVCKISSKYHSKGGAPIKEGCINMGKERASAMYKAMEDYIHANPDY